MATVAVSHFILLGSYAKLEKGRLKDDLKRTQNVLQTEFRGLDQILQHYATWDATYNLIEKPTSDYGTRNLSEVTMQNLRVKVAVIVNHKGRIVFLQSFRPGSANEVSTADREVLVRIAESAQLIAETQSFSGVVSFSDGPALVSARHVLMTSGEGPSRGVMVMVRELDCNLLASLSTQVKVPLVLREVQKLAKDRAGLLRDVQAHSNFASWALDAESISGFALVNDLWGRPRFLPEMQHDRAIWREGMKAAHILNLSVLLLGLAFCGLAVWSASRDVIRPIEKITQFARAFRSDSSMAARLTLNGSAEIGQLGGQINEMLNEIQLSNQKLVAVRERLKFEATHDALTGAWNCAAALELLDREIGRSEREDSTVAVLMLDLDHFKLINDQFGMLRETSCCKLSPHRSPVYCARPTFSRAMGEKSFW